ncbi:MAG: mandelate racemase/muconate lactonizing enzyme family protein [Lautropia sp.]
MARGVITAVDVEPLAFPLSPPFRAAVRLIDRVCVALVRVRDDAGREGCGTAFAFGDDDLRPIVAVARALGAGRVGADAAAPERNAREMMAALALAGAGGPAIAALSAIDLALWDLLGQRAGLPLWRLLGAARDSVPTYGSGGSLALPTDALAAEMAGFVAAGHRAVKLKVGHGIAGDRTRIAAVREAVGADVRIAADGNQQWTPKGAIRWAQAMADLDLWWLEEPVRADDLAGHAEVRAGTPIDIASGETLFGASDAARCITTRAVDVVMPNLQRIGGISAWRKVAAAAELAGVPVAAHVYPEVQLHLMCAQPNGLVLEWWPGWPWLWQESIAIADGRARPPEQPGLGFTLDTDRVAAHRMERRR